MDPPSAPYQRIPGPDGPGDDSDDGGDAGYGDTDDGAPESGRLGLFTVIYTCYVAAFFVTLMAFAASNGHRSCRAA